MTSIGIIGSGFGGVGTAVEFLRNGYRDVELWERADDLGGVWRDNTYPGAACDVPSPLYEFSWAPGRTWSRRYSGQAEISAYLRRVAVAEGVLERVRFGRRVASARWLDDVRRWEVRFADGSTTTVDVLVSAVGQLANPVQPSLDGLDAFDGEVVHAGRWPASFDARGRRIAVVGSAATAVQLVPRLVREAAHVTVFQRTPNYVLPKPDGPYPRWYRPMLGPERRFWRMLGEQFSRGLDPHDPVAGVLRRVARWQLERQVRDPAMRAALTPTYPIGCKRILFSNDFYPALQARNATFVPSAVAGADVGGVRSAGGRTFDVDTIVFATGFEAQDFLSGIEIEGRDGVQLADAWRDGARAHLGIYVPGFPNLFLSYGPNTNLGGSSILLMHEAQARHMRLALDRMQATGAATVEPSALAESQWDVRVQRGLAGTAWVSCSNWYRHPVTGRITSNWPGGTRAYERRVARLDPAEFAWA